MPKKNAYVCSLKDMGKYAYNSTICNNPKLEKT